jgi:hypothetical protein
MSNFKILYCYSWFKSEAYGNIEKISLDYLERLNNAGYSVEGFCLTLNPPGPRLGFKELDARWKRGEKTLYKMYEKLEKALENKHVLINSSGINLHPEFVEQLSVYTIFQCFDDPESSEDLSKPVALSYDMCFVGNIAEVDTYKKWGVKNAEWMPMGLTPNIYDPSITYESILNGDRDIELFMMIDRLSPWRIEKLNKIDNAFPNAHFYGRGWKRGYLPNNQELNFLKRAKIGPNFHNTTGPINYRTYYLPANGVMQICDNKDYLGNIYKLNEEVVGFDTVEECIYLCKYYLTHEDERRQIAANGWKKAITDYNELAVFKKVINYIDKNIKKKVESHDNYIPIIKRRKIIPKWLFMLLFASPFILKKILKRLCGMK